MPPVEFAPKLNLAHPLMAPRVATPVHAPLAGPVTDTRKQTLRAAGSETVETLEDTRTKPDLQDHAIDALSKVQRVGMSFWAIGWVPLPGLPIPLPVFGIAGWFAGKFGWKGAQTAITMAPHSLTEALETIKLNKLHKLPGQVLHNAADMAKATPNTFVANWEPRLRQTAGQIDGRMDAAAQGVGRVTQPVRGVLNRSVDQFGGSAIGKQVTDGMQGFVRSRLDVNLKKQTKTLSETKAAFTAEPRGMMDWLLRRKPNPVALPEKFSSVFEQVQKAERLQGSERIGALQKGFDALRELRKDKNLPKELGTHASAIEAQLSKSLSAASKTMHYQDVLGGGVSTLIKNAAKGAGNVKVLTAVIATAVAAGAGVAFLNANKENGAANKALKDLAEDVGNPHHPLIEAARKSAHQQAGGRMMNAGLSSAGDAMMLGGTSMIAPAVGIQGSLMAFGQMLVTGNPILDAHTNLRQAEQGKIKLEPAQKLFFIKSLVGAMPTVATHGGIYNRLTTPIAQQLMDRNLSTHAMLHVLGNSESFTALAKEVAEKHAAEVTQAKTAPVAKIETPLAHENDTPSLKLGERALQGRIQAPTQKMHA